MSITKIKVIDKYDFCQPKNTVKIEMSITNKID